MRDLEPWTQQVRRSTELAWLVSVCTGVTSQFQYLLKPVSGTIWAQVLTSLALLIRLKGKLLHGLLRPSSLRIPRCLRRHALQENVLSAGCAWSSSLETTCYSARNHSWVHGRQLIQLSSNLSLLKIPSICTRWPWRQSSSLKRNCEA